MPVARRAKLASLSRPAPKTTVMSRSTCQARSQSARETRANPAIPATEGQQP
jgi:hypothetical protein